MYSQRSHHYGEQALVTGNLFADVAQNDWVDRIMPSEVMKIDASIKRRGDSRHRVPKIYYLSGH